MRIPLHQTYRAFRELDGFSDEQCEQWVRRVKAQFAIRHLVIATVVAGVTFSVAGAIGVGSQIPLEMLDVFEAGSSPEFAYHIFSLLIFPPGAAGLSWLIVRDRLLIRAIRNRVLLVRCPRCRYSLLGLRHEDGFVLCPECGTRHELAALGLSPADLIGPRDAA
ncbi:MAG: hypothetical protein KIS87_06645 [Phycisphaeraceae bacterium]|nr:hypothetical protein [Phycisphaeraceae bacterium]